MCIVEVTTGDDKMRAALALATCTDEKQQHLATQLLDQIVDQCFQTHEWKRNCPRRVAVEDQRRRLAAPDHAKWWHLGDHQVVWRAAGIQPEARRHERQDGRRPVGTPFA